MKKQPSTSTKSRVFTGTKKHLRPEGKRVANKATRRIGRKTLAETTTRAARKLLELVKDAREALDVKGVALKIIGEGAEHVIVRAEDKQGNGMVVADVYFYGVFSGYQMLRVEYQCCDTIFVSATGENLARLIRP